MIVTDSLKVSDVIYDRSFEGKNTYFQLQPNFNFLMFKKFVSNLNVVDVLRAVIIQTSISLAEKRGKMVPGRFF